jgi:hypothetical protein
LARQGRQGAARLALLAHQVLTQRYGWRLLTTSSDSPRMLTPWFESCGPRGGRCGLRSGQDLREMGRLRRDSQVAERSDAHPRPLAGVAQDGARSSIRCAKSRASRRLSGS